LSAPTRPPGRPKAGCTPSGGAKARSDKLGAIWLFDLDNTLHDASRAVFARLNGSMTDYIEQHLGLPRDEANALRVQYWRRYGATLLGLERHHGIRAAHFLAQTHALPGLEAQLRMPLADRLALKRLPGRKVLLTNAPLDYAKRVLTALDMATVFESVVSIEGMRTFGHLRPKPDLRMMKVVLARLKLPAHRCVLVEDTLENLRPVRQLGMRTVWMQRYLKDNPHGPHAGGSPHRRPAWVCAKIRHLRSLHAWGA
jgi:putative hydrolase of the HAD superfamily